jgi:DNA polymerase-3 subunit epsilon
MQHRPLVFLDIETTGGSHLNSRVLEIGALRVENGHVVATMNRLIDPQESVPTFITGLTGISNEMIVGAPTFSEVVDELHGLLDGAIFIAHNVAFDYNFIKMEYRNIQRPFNMDRLCTVRLSRSLYPAQRRHNLDTLIAAHGFTVSSRHRALDDAQVLFDFYQKSIAEHGLKAHAAMSKILTKARTTN